MTTAMEIRSEQIDDDTMLAVVAGGDCSKLTPAQRLQYYRSRCEAAGLDPRTVPFGFIAAQGKTILYALKSCTDQLAMQHGVVCTILEQKTDGDLRVVTVRVVARDGRQTEDIGAVPLGKKSGDDLANALMKAVTKAKRRAILGLCGLGMMDESEAEAVQGARDVTPPRIVPPVAEPAKEEVSVAGVKEKPPEKTTPAPAGPSANEPPAETPATPILAAVAAAKSQTELDAQVTAIGKLADPFKDVARAAWVAKATALRDAGAKAA